MFYPVVAIMDNVDVGEWLVFVVTTNAGSP